MFHRAFTAGLLLAAASVPAFAEEAAKPLANGVSQADYETFMGCYGNLEGALDLLARVGPMSNNPDGFSEMEAGGRALVSASLEPVATALSGPRYGLDRQAGSAAEAAARAPHDVLAGAGYAEQVAHFKAHGEMTATCQSTIERLVAATGVNQAAAE